MWDCISFMISNGKMILNNDIVLPLGTAARDVLNISDDIYEQMYALYEKANACFDRYIDSRLLNDWHEANQRLIELDEMLIRYPLFRYLRRGNEILQYVRKITSPAHECAVNDSESRQYGNISGGSARFIRAANTGTCNYSINRLISGIPLSVRRRNTICKPDIEYSHLCVVYGKMLEDIRVFGTTIRYCWDSYISSDEKINSISCLQALAKYLSGTPFAAEGSNLSESIFDYYKWETAVDVEYTHPVGSTLSDPYRLYASYTTCSLLFLLKIDLYESLNAGHMIRRCGYCRKFFLLENGYHAKYCSTPPDESTKYSCAQLAYRNGFSKESAGNNPLGQTMNRCYNRLKKSFQRNNITREERDLLWSKAQTIYWTYARSGIEPAELDKMLCTDNLYRKCDIEKRRGRSN